MSYDILTGVLIFPIGPYFRILVVTTFPKASIFDDDGNVLKDERQCNLYYPLLLLRANPLLLLRASV